MLKTNSLPAYFLRIGGLPISEISKIFANDEFEKTTISSIISFQDTQGELKIDLCELLQRFIREKYHVAGINSVVNIRRNIFNEKKIGAKDILIAFELLPGQLIEQVNSYLKYRDLVINNIDHFYKIYNNKLVSEKRSLHSIFTNEVFLKGLLLSSRVFFNELQKQDQREFKADTRSISKKEESLIKYFTRICTKTSPFGAFTNFAYGEDNNSIEDPISIVEINNQESVNGFAKLNYYLALHFKSLMIYKPNINRLIPIRLNPTLLNKNGVITFLTNQNNIEAFQSLNSNHALLKIIEIVKSIENCTLSSLIDLLSNIIDNPRNEIEDQLNHLIQYGLLEFNLGETFDQTGWLKPFVKELESLSLASNDVHLDRLIYTLSETQRLCATLNAHNYHNRPVIMDLIFSMLKASSIELLASVIDPKVNLFKVFASKNASIINRYTDELIKSLNLEPRFKQIPSFLPSDDIFKKSSLTYFHFKHENIIYEDCKRNIEVSFNQGSRNGILKNLNLLNSFLQPLNYNVHQRRHLSAFFKSKYGSKTKTSLLKFYHDYFDYYARDDVKDQFILPFVPKAEYRNTIANFENSFAPLAEKHNLLRDNELRITLDVLDNINVQGANMQEYNCSLSYYLQYYVEDNQLKSVLNNIYQGFGKVISRFLYAYPGSSDLIRAFNMTLSKGRLILAELTDNSYYNGNMHLPLLDYQCDIPGGLINKDSKYHIPISNLELHLTSKDNDLVLVDKISNMQVQCFDLGLLNLKNRSNLFKLLNVFTSDKSVNIREFLEICNKIYGKVDGKGKRLPRIILEDNVILQRKKWIFYRDGLQELKKETADNEYFIWLNKWRLKNEIPVEVFVKKMKGTNDVLSNDDFKPQYLRLDSPLFVNFFRKYLSKWNGTLVIEEMKPSKDDLIKIGQEAFVTEFIEHTYSN